MLMCFLQYLSLARWSPSSRPRLPTDDSDCRGMAKHALVLRSGQPVISSSTVATTGGKSADSALQRVPSLGPFQPESACLAPRGHTTARVLSRIATRIKAPQRCSTRGVYELKWSMYVKWCQSNQVDFRSPSIKQITDFLLYLFQERHLQPSTIDGYRTAITDKTGKALPKVRNSPSFTLRKEKTKEAS